MNDKKCMSCSEYKRCKESSVSWIFFIIGLIATIAVRAVTVLVHINPIYGQIAWYVGVMGFLIFFVYKFRVEHTRSRLIRNSKLMHKISQDENIEKGDREAISSILCALSSNKDKINYFVIFASSVVAIVLAIYLDFLK